jgi:hypothetical protein
MRIKFNDKIYRLKEIESGVDSLMELVEESKYNDGDFLHSDWNGENITIIYRKRNCIRLYYHASKSNRIGLDFDKEGFWPDGGDFRLATESEKKELIDALAEVGKRWNAEKKCVENWLEPWIDEPKVGDWVIYWDSIQTAKVGILACIRPDERYKYVVDDGDWWRYAVKWDGTKEHLEKIRKG